MCKHHLEMTIATTARLGACQSRSTNFLDNGICRWGLQQSALVDVTLNDLKLWIL